MLFFNYYHPNIFRRIDCTAVRKEFRTYVKKLFAYKNKAQAISGRLYLLGLTAQLIRRYIFAGGLRAYNGSRLCVLFGEAARGKGKRGRKRHGQGKRNRGEGDLRARIFPHGITTRLHCKILRERIILPLCASTRAIWPFANSRPSLYKTHPVWNGSRSEVEIRRVRVYVH